MGFNHIASYVRDARPRDEVVPYLNLEYGRFFARIDTLGMQLAPVGYGYLEAVMQIRTDGYKRPGSPSRPDSTPVGLGTLQITPVGAFGLQVLHDFGASRSTLVQARYLAELPLGRLHIYPELGAEYQARRYTRYYYGSDCTDTPALTQRPARSAVTHYVGAMIEAEITPHWAAHLYFRHRLFDSHATQGTLVDVRHSTDYLASVTYRF